MVWGCGELCWEWGAASTGELCLTTGWLWLRSLVKMLLLSCVSYSSLTAAAKLSDSVRPHRRQPTRLPRPWDSPGKNTGVGCHFLLQCIKVKSEREVTQSCPTLRDPTDCRPPGSSIRGIFQARVLEWVTIAFSQWRWGRTYQIWILSYLIFIWWDSEILCFLPTICIFKKWYLRFHSSFSELTVLSLVGIQQNPLTVLIPVSEILIILQGNV